MGTDQSNIDSNRVAIGSTDAQSPLYSEYASDPDMAELVEMFVSDLPNRISSLEKAIQDQDFDTITHLSHQLKGAAGGYGFTPITVSAAQVEKLATAQSDHDELRIAVSDLMTLCRRATDQPK